MLLPTTAFVFLSLSVHTFSQTTHSEDILDPVRITELFNQFVEEYGKEYPTPSDQMNAFAAFSANLQKIEDLKKEFKDQNVEFGINQYADLNDVEFGEHVANLKMYEGEEEPPTELPGRSSGSLPSFLDWRTRKNTVGRVGDQGTGDCGWAFAVSSAVQSAYSFKISDLVEPLGRELCECSSAKSVREGLEYVKKFGVPLEGNGSCEWDEKISVDSFFAVSPNTNGGLQRALVEKGPILVEFQVGSAFRHYKSGVFNGTDCRNTGTFIGWSSALLIGYDSEYGVPFWTLKNSWGTKFGEGGYFRLARGVDLCSLESTPSYYIDY